MITLAYDAIVLTLSDDLLWTDEYSWSAVSQRRDYSITGAQIIDSGLKQKGRPITLAGGDNYGWLSRSLVDALAIAAMIPDKEFTLTLRGNDYSVVFDQMSQPLTVEPVWDVRDPVSDDNYIVTLRFIEV